MTLKVLADFHHDDLFESLQILFEDRFGGEVWAPAGMDWFDSGTWQFEKEWHGDAVARQYLEGIWGGSRRIGRRDFNEAGEPAYADHFWIRDDPRHPGRVTRGLTYEVARETKWDIIISTLPANDKGLHQLAKETGARFGIQLGNNMQYSAWNLADFALASTTYPGLNVEPGVITTVPGCPTVIYHQEFNTETFRHEWPPTEPNSVASFVQCFAENKVPYAEFLDLARAAPDLDWKVYGNYGSHEPDEFAAGNCTPVPAVADAMRRSRIIWHSKSWSDGFGHVIHNAFCVGRPVVGRASYYADKLAAPLWVEGVTSFDIDRYNQSELLTILRRLRDDDDYHRTISQNAAMRFREVVDFDREADAIAEMLGVMVPA